MFRFTLTGVVLLLLTGAQASRYNPGEDVAKLKARIEKLEAEIAALKQAVAPGPHQNLMREMAPLKQWAGSWKGESKQDNKWEYRQTAKAEWVMDGFFLQTNYSVERIAPPHKTHGMVMMSYDPAKETFRRWEFGSDGTMAESLGTWDQKTRSMTWTYQTAQVKIVTLEMFADDDTIVWHDVVKNQEGKVIGETHGQKKRRK